jgi:hypothetical protein
MNMVKIVCPKCSAEGKLSLVDANYTGPRRCWKCHQLFSISIKNGAVISSEPMSEEDYQHQMEAKAAKEGVTNFKFNSPTSNDDIPRLSSERRRNYNQPLNSPSPASNQPAPEPAAPAEPPKPKDPPLPYDRPRTFVPMADDPAPAKKEPEKPPKPKNPAAPKTLSDVPRVFIPPAT